MTLVIAPIKNPFGIVKWNSKNKLTSFDEKPTLNHFIGYAVIESKIFNYLSKLVIAVVLNQVNPHMPTIHYTYVNQPLKINKLANVTPFHKECIITQGNKRPVLNLNRASPIPKTKRGGVSPTLK